MESIARRGCLCCRRSRFNPIIRNIRWFESISNHVCNIIASTRTFNIDVALILRRYMRSIRIHLHVLPHDGNNYISSGIGRRKCVLLFQWNHILISILHGSVSDGTDNAYEYRSAARPLEARSHDNYLEIIEPITSKISSRLSWRNRRMRWGVVLLTWSSRWEEIPTAYFKYFVSADVDVAHKVVRHWVIMVY